MKKGLFSVLLALLLLSALSGAALAANAPFSDVPADAWYAGAAVWCRENRIIDGAGGRTFSPDTAMGRAALANNSSAAALRELLKKGPLTIDMNDYGNFEKVGPLGTTLPRNDEQVTTSAGDIILWKH